jgi:hypothetical protein
VSRRQASNSGRLFDETTSLLEKKEEDHDDGWVAFKLDMGYVRWVSNASSIRKQKR